MLETQKYLLSKNLDDLTNELGIIVKKHDNLPLAILNYHQIDSPKTHPVVRECRGLVLNTNDNSVVAKSFHRFFNWGELQDEMNLFDFSDFIVQEKLDGSLVLLYHFNNSWFANTRGSFATDFMEEQNFTWTEGFCRALGIKNINDLSLDKELTYICEFCSPWNKVVHTYHEPKMYFLTAFNGITELSYQEYDRLNVGPLIKPNRTEFSSIQQILNYLVENSADNPTFEGFVIRDKNNLRYKVKSETYRALHRLRGENGNLYSAKTLVPLILSGGEEKILRFYPEVSERFFSLKETIEEWKNKLLKTWRTYKDVSSQKEFAVSILSETEFASILFNVRKKFGTNQTEEDIVNEWSKSSELIIKQLK